MTRRLRTQFRISRTKCCIVLWLMCVSGLSARGDDAPPAEESRASGEISLKLEKAQFLAPIVARLGSELKAPVYAGIVDVLGTNAISFGTLVQNPTNRPLYYAFYYALFDDQHRLIAAGGNFKNRPLKSDEQPDAALCMLFKIPKGVGETANSFQAVFYESTRPIGELALGEVKRASIPTSLKDGANRSPRRKIELPKFQGEHSKGDVVLTVGNMLKFDARFHTFEAGSVQRLWGGGTLRNTAASELSYSYGAAFFDLDGNLIAAADRGFGGWELKKNEAVDLRCSIDVPSGLLKTISTFDIALHESPKNFPLR